MFTDGKKVYFIFGEDGNLYIVQTDEMDLVNRDILCSAVIDHVDRETNTIWFSTPLPEGVKLG